MTMKTLWDNSLKILCERIPQKEYRGYLDHMSFISGDDSHIEVMVPSLFIKDRIVDRFLPGIKDILIELSGRKYDIEFKIAQPSAEKKPEDIQADKPRALVNVPKREMDSRYAFETFVVSSCNQLAHAAATAVANSPGKVYNPLFIYGGVGLGKTHLLNAIKQRLISDPFLRVYFLSAEKFTNECIYSIKNQKMEQFRHKYRESCGALLIDDIQFIAGMEKTQEEFFHTFNALYEAHRQIVITSDKIPSEIPDMEERLRSRFGMGLIADIQPPDLETKVAIVKKKCDMERIAIPDEVAFFIASKAHSNIRELEGFITRIQAHASLSMKPITIELAKEAVQDLIPRQRAITVDDIEGAVADFYNIKSSDIKSHRRMKVIAFPRQVAMYLCRKLTNLSFPEIGEKFGGKDHSTIVHAHNKIKNLCNQDPAIRSAVDTLVKSIKAKYV